jgi:PBP1b-binding outer membrane lipoprotein LpoB
MKKTVIGLCIAFFYVGCSSTNQSNITYEEYKPKKHTVKPTTVKQNKPISKQTVPTSGIIKGKVTKLFYANGLWHYEVVSQDTSNNKLPFIKFTHSKSLAKKGDYVYAIVKNSKLSELFLLQKANIQQKKPIKTKKTKVKTHNKKNRKQILSVPTTESIAL